MTLLIIGGRPRTIELADDLGIEVVNVLHPLNATSGRPGDVVVDYTDEVLLRECIDRLRLEHDLTNAMSLTEPGLVPAATARAHLGSPWSPEHRSAEILRDKLRMREAIAAVPGVVAVPAVPARTPHDLLRFGEEFGYPFIMKPVDASGSLGVRLVRGIEDVAEVVEALEALTADTHRAQYGFFPLSAYMLEVYLDGPEFSVEAFSRDGVHEVLGVTQKLLGENFLERGHVFPAGISEHDRALLDRATCAVLDAVGHRQGPSHTELRLTARGPAVIESHDRIGGDRILDLVRLVTGFDMERAAVAWAGGGADGGTRSDEVVPAAATRFELAAPGRVQRLGNAEMVKRRPAVADAVNMLDVGDEVTGSNGNWDRVAQVIATGASADEALTAAEGALSALTEGVSIA